MAPRRMRLLLTGVLLALITTTCWGSPWKSSRIVDQDLNALKELHGSFCNSCLQIVLGGETPSEWNLAVDPCGSDTHWYGVGCAEVPGKANTTELVVATLRISGQLTSEGRSGLGASEVPFLLNHRFPPAIAGLTHLVVLDLSGNKLNGSVPPWINRLTQLQELTLSSNFLTGLPSELGTLTQLQQLKISRNLLGQGTLPAELAYLTSLTNLNLEENNLQGEMPSFIAGLTSLRYLDLSFNRLGGKLPRWLKMLYQLQVLNIEMNEFSGSLPSFLSRIPVLYLQGNNFCSSELGKPCEKLTPLTMGVVIGAALLALLVLGCLGGAMWHYCRDLRFWRRRQSMPVQPLAVARGGHSTELAPLEEGKPEGEVAHVGYHLHVPVYMDGELIGMAFPEDEATPSVPTMLPRIEGNEARACSRSVPEEIA